MKREVIATKKAPAAVGPYSQAIRVGDFVFTAGQLALDPATGKLVEGAIEEQTRQVLTNIAAVLEAAGSSLDKVVKTTVFLEDMGDFRAMNEVYGEFFADEPPARSTVEVAFLPLGAQVEIDAIAVVG
jgi:2-iminobutanoate/2-iminopropanoate deaminase